MSDAPTFSHSYMITNRTLKSGNVPNTSFDDIVPIDGNGLYFFSASGSYNNSPSDFKIDPKSDSTPQTTWPKTFLRHLQADLALTSQTNPSLTVYIHGMGNDWDVATNSSMQFGEALQSGISQYAGTSDPPAPPSPNGQYNGLLIGFSWPSFNGVGGLDSGVHYGAYNQSKQKTEPTPNIRANILGSLESFATLMTLLSDLPSKVTGLTINIICHSEGNYMMMAGMQNLAAPSPSLSIQQVILLAADVNNGALQQTDSTSSNDLTTGISSGPGSGAPIADLINPVSVFYSNKDSTLKESQELYSKKYHNLGYPDRLGREGPYSFTDGTLISGVSGINCSAVADGKTDHPFTPLHELYDHGWIPLKEAPTGSIHINEHGSYRFVPQILWVISQLLASGGSFKTLPYDVTQVGSTVGSYTMAFDKP